MDETNKKRIEVVEMRVGDIKFGFGNPRKIKKKKKEELERSIEQYGDFGLFLIDENNNAIGGNQRATTMAAQDPDRIVLCKRLIGCIRTGVAIAWIRMCQLLQTHMKLHYSRKLSSSMRIQRNVWRSSGEQRSRKG